MRTRNSTSRGGRYVAALAAAAMVLTACGGSDTDDAAVADDAADDAPAEDAPADDEPADEEPADEAPADDGEVYKLTYASNVPEGGLIEAGTEWWISEIESRSNGRIEIEAFFGGALLGGAEIYRGLQDGVIDIGHVSQSRVNEELPFWGVTGLPFITDDPTATQRATSELLATDANFAAQFEAEGMKPLYVKPLLAEVSGFSSPVTSLDEYNGLRLRGLGGPVNDAVAALGADMVDVNSPEIFEATQRGTIDGWTQQTLDLAVGNSLHEVSPYFVEAGLGTIFPIGNLMRLESFEALPADLQQLIEELNEEYIAASVERAEELETGFCDTLLDSGGSVFQIPEAEVDAWRAEVEDDLVDAWVGNVAGLTGLGEDEVRDFYDNYIDAVRRYESDSTYVNGLEACAARS